MARKFGSFATLVLLGCGLAVAAPATRPAAPKDESINHPDGTLASKVRLNAAGERHGDFTGYFPGGKKVQERSRYEKGKLHGVRSVYDEKGTLVAEETWYEGKLVFPKSVNLIEATRKQIKNEVIDYIRNNRPTVPKGGPSLEAIADALTRLRTYRFLCDVPRDVGVDSEYIDLCQHGAECMEKLNKLTHGPERPDGVTDEFYEKAKAGCGRSNIFSSNNIASGVDAYMDDSDKGNIDRLGHRRWLLNPKMQNTGFGAGTSRYSAMYSFDAKRTEVPDYDFVCFPPRGYYPAKDFRAHFAWHASFNTKKFGVPEGSAKMAIYPVDNKLARAKDPLPLNYEHVDTGGFGIPNAVIARPKELLIKPGAMYEVVITGLKPKDGGAAEVSYFVAFY